MPRGVKSKSAPAKKTAAKKSAAKSAPRARRIETPASATFGEDDKRAQYARLIVYNFGVAEGLIPKKSDVNSATNAQIERAALKLVGGTLIEGSEGIEYIMELSEKGSTTGRPLTLSYAQEVRPFLRRLLFSDNFGRRAGERKPREATTTAQRGSKTKTAGAKKKTSARKTRSTRAPKVEAPAEEVTNDAEAVDTGEAAAA